LITSALLPSSMTTLIARSTTKTASEPLASLLEFKGER